MTPDPDYSNTSWLRWLPATLYAALIFWSSSTYAPVPVVPMQHADKVMHFIEFGLLCYLICWALEPSRRSLNRIMWIAILTSAAYGATDELHQSFTPLRHPEAGDWWADTFGAVAVGLLWRKAALTHLEPQGSNEDAT